MTELSVDALVLDPREYAAVRPEQRAAAIALRRSRRVHLGDMLVVEFENAETLRYQAQEMLYVEGVTDPAAAAAELGAYERMLPGGRSLTATMMVEIADQSAVRAELGRLAGIHDRVRLEVAGESCPAHDVPPPDEGPAQRTFSVHFLRFDLTEAAVAGLAAGPARLVVDHPEYEAAAELGDDVRRQLTADLAGE